MGQQKSFHAPGGGSDFLGLRPSRAGGMEIVYDNGSKQRMIWRVESKCSDAVLSDVLQVAVASTRVVPTLLEELKKRSILIDPV